MVEDYIKANLGPRAVLSDSKRIAQTLQRAMPLMPGLIEDAIWRARQQAEPPPKPRRFSWRSAAIGSGATMLAVAVLAAVVS